MITVEVDEWLGIARVTHTQLLETTSLLVEAVAIEVYFKAAAALREQFLRVASVSLGPPCRRGRLQEQGSWL